MAEFGRELRGNQGKEKSVISGGKVRREKRKKMVPLYLVIRMGEEGYRGNERFLPKRSSKLEEDGGGRWKRVASLRSLRVSDCGSRIANLFLFGICHQFLKKSIFPAVNENLWSVQVKLFHHHVKFV